MSSDTSVQNRYLLILTPILGASILPNSKPHLELAVLSPSILYGHPCDMDTINHIGAVHGLWVVEDAAEAHFAKYKGRTTGSLGTLATFSFYGNKILTSGEGGAVTINDPALELRMRTLRGQGMDPQRRYYFPVTGYNFRLTNVACALLCAQLERCDQILKRRTQIFSLYREHLAD